MTQIEKMHAARSAKSAQKQEFTKKLFDLDPQLPTAIVDEVLHSKFGGGLHYSLIDKHRPSGTTPRRMPRSDRGSERKTRHNIDSVAKLLRTVLESLDAPATVIGQRDGHGEVTIRVRSFIEREV